MLIENDDDEKKDDKPKDKKPKKGKDKEKIRQRREERRREKEDGKGKGKEEKGSDVLKENSPEPVESPAVSPSMQRYTIQMLTIKQQSGRLGKPYEKITYLPLLLNNLSWYSSLWSKWSTQVPFVVCKGLRP